MSNYEQFVANAQSNGQWHDQIKGNGGFDYNHQVDRLIQLSYHINGNLLIYLFGQQLGQHLTQKYIEADRNLLVFLGQLDSLYRFYMLHELKTNETLFAHC